MVTIQMTTLFTYQRYIKIFTFFLLIAYLILIHHAIQLSKPVIELTKPVLKIQPGRRTLENCLWMGMLAYLYISIGRVPGFLQLKNGATLKIT
jgi:hypothetical protein